MMTEEMTELAYTMHEAARKYRLLYELEHGTTPVIWVDNKETGECLFIADSFCSGVLKKCL